jgi:hypothetical protein
VTTVHDRHRPQRNWGARVRESRTAGLETVVLENERLRVGVLAGMGADVVELNLKRRDLDFAWLAPGGVRAPAPGAVDAVAPFVDRYPGGWQEVLPNGGAPSSHAGASYAQHGEVCLLPWDHDIVADEPDQVAVRFTVGARKVPLRLARTMRLASGSTSVELHEVLENASGARVEVMWGHHIALGPPFLRPGCRIAVPAGVEVLTHDGEGVHPAGRRVAPGRHRWPQVPAPGGGTIDLRELPERGAPSEMLYLTGFAEGRYEVTDPERGVGLRVAWDATVMPYLWLWQELGAHVTAPWWGRMYTLGLEPFTSLPTDGLAAAVRNGTALRLAPRERRELTLAVSVVEHDEHGATFHGG